MTPQETDPDLPGPGAQRLASSLHVSRPAASLAFLLGPRVPGPSQRAERLAEPWARTGLGRSGKARAPLACAVRENVCLRLNFQKTKIMASGPITSWEIDGETVEAVRLYFSGLQNHYRW